MRKARLASVVALVVGGLLTLLWLGACARYVEGVIGWERLQSAPPHELALLVAGAATPLAFVWLLLLYLVRGFTISEETAALLARLEAMTYPAEGSAERVAAITDSLEEQASTLSEASDGILGRLEALRNSFRQQSQELTGASVRAASQAEQIRGALRAQSDEISAAGERVSDLLAASGMAIGTQIETLAAAGE